MTQAAFSCLVAAARCMLICFPDLMSSTINLKSRQPVPDILAPGFEVTLLLLLLSQEAMLRLGEFGSSPYQVENHMKIFPYVLRMELLLPLTSSWGSSIKVTSAKGILPMLSTRCSFPLWVLVVMMRWLEKRKHCLTDSRSPPPSLMLMPLPLIKRLLPVPPHPESEHR